MSNEELEELKLGRRPDNRDWRDEGWVTPVKNQGRCGSCWAFGAIAALEGSYAKRRGTLRAFSEQQIVDCVTVRDGNPCCGGCKGGHIDQVFAWLKNNN